MARRRRYLALSAEQARQALVVLVQEGKVAVGEIRKALQRRERLIRALRTSLTALEHGVGSLGRRLAKRAGPAKRKASRRKLRISAATLKKYQAQGRYMAAVRPLTKEKRARIRAIREKSGVRAATAAAKRMVKQGDR